MAYDALTEEIGKTPYKIKELEVDHELETIISKCKDEVYKL